MSHFDFVVVGSGFGGSVSALRLAEKGYRVAVIEQGKRASPENMKRAATSIPALTWLPMLGWKGHFAQRFFRHIGLIRGIGVGGGSLVYAAVLLRAKGQFYRSDVWRDLADWEQELDPHYSAAEHMLGVNVNPYQSDMDWQLRDTAEALGCGDSWRAVPQGIFFGEPDKKVSDPYFNGLGPDRVGCNKCGHCISGCHVGAKNSLDKNYLYFAERRGVQIFPETRVDRLIPIGNNGYRIVTQQGLGWRKKEIVFTADKIVLAGGVLGTLELLFKCRDQYKTLPKISNRLGDRVRTNSEALVASLSNDKAIDLSEGTTISSDFYFNESTHITQNRIPPSQYFMRFYMGPLVDGDKPLTRALRVMWLMLRHPWKSTQAWRARDWGKRATVLTVMQVVDNALAIKWGRRLWAPWKKGLVTKIDADNRTPAYIEAANASARKLAEVSNGTPLNILGESVGNLSLTAHILGGCFIGANEKEGVVDEQHRLFGYPDIYVTDASAIPANVGVNPSLTITAMAERCMSKIPDKADIEAI